MKKAFMLGIAMGLLLFVGPMRVQAGPKHTDWVNQGSEYAGTYGECVPDKECGTKKGTQTADLLQDQKCQDVDGSGTNICTKNATKTVTVGTTSQSCEVKEIKCEEKVYICHWEVCQAEEGLRKPEPECKDKWKIIKEVSSISPDFLYKGGECKGGGCREAWCEANQPKDEPEPTSVPCTQNCGNPPTFQGSTTQPNNPSCNGVYTDMPLLQHFIRTSPTSVELGWWKPIAGVDKYSLVYGYYGEAMMHGVADIANNVTRFTIGALRANTPIQAQLWAWRGQCVTRSVIIDP